MPKDRKPAQHATAGEIREMLKGVEDWQRVRLFSKRKATFKNPGGIGYRDWEICGTEIKANEGAYVNILIKRPEKTGR